jgi:hypothetical protein
MDIFQDAIVFPIRTGGADRHHVEYIYPNWRSLKSKVPLENCDNYGIQTGKNNNITVLQIHHVLLSFLGFEDPKTLQITTPNGYVCFLFEYEPRIETIYKLSFHISLFNDNSYIVGGQYHHIENQHIKKMPQPILDHVLALQASHNTDFNSELYDLLMLLSDDWFGPVGDIRTQRNSVERLTRALHNSSYNATDWVNTLRKYLAERWDYYNELDFLALMRIKMDGSYSRISFLAFHKLIARDNEIGYKRWKQMYHSTKRKKLIYKDGSMVDLRTAKRIFPLNKLTPEVLARVNPSMTIAKKDTCKSCGKLFRMGCCTRYNRKNRSGRMFILNSEIV